MSKLIGQCGFLGVVRVRYVIAIDDGACTNVNAISERSSPRRASLLRPADVGRTHGQDDIDDDWRRGRRKTEDHLDPVDTLMLPSLCPAVCPSVHFAAVRFAVIICPGRSKAARGSTVGGEMLQNGTVIKTQ